MGCETASPASSWNPVAAPPFSMAAKHVSRHCRMSTGEGAERPPVETPALDGPWGPWDKKGDSSCPSWAPGTSVLLCGGTAPLPTCSQGHPRGPDPEADNTDLAPVLQGIQGGPVPAPKRAPRALGTPPPHGGPVDKTLRSQCRGPGFEPWSGN